MSVYPYHGFHSNVYLSVPILETKSYLSFNFHTYNKDPVWSTNMFFTIGIIVRSGSQLR